MGTLLGKGRGDASRTTSFEFFQIVFECFEVPWHIPTPALGTLAFYYYFFI